MPSLLIGLTYHGAKEVSLIVASRGSDQFPVRFPDGMRDKVKALAARNGRSMNSEIIYALFAHLRAATGEGLANTAPAAASSNNAALAGGASINRG